MDKNITALKPEAVWRHFAEICKIPHPSSHEDAIAEYVVDFAKRHNIDYSTDEIGNVILRKPATAGMEHCKTITLQSHFDMVPQKNGDKVFDFLKDPIEAYIDGEWVTANGTTLGADNGIGMAAMLAVFEDTTLVHGALEALFTRTEETGMCGAFALKEGFVRGDILLNLDSEHEGELCVGCAGGLDANIKFEYDTIPVPNGSKALKIDIKGLKGGHSGIQIVLQRANANRLLCRLIYELGCVDIASIDGGGLRNAIPREATAVVIVGADRVEEIKKYASQFQKTLVTEFEGIEDGIQVVVNDIETPKEMIRTEVSANLVKAVFGAPNGVIKMSVSMDSLAETSTNLARVVSSDGVISVQCLLRGSVRSEKFELGAMISAVFQLAGAEVTLSGAYDGWNPNMSSPILKTMKESYKALYGKEPKVAAIHAGLECGIIGGVCPDLDMISFGPTICFPHSPDEKVEVASVAKFYDYLIYILANAPKKA